MAMLTYRPSFGAERLAALRSRSSQFTQEPGTAENGSYCSAQGTN